MRVIPTGVGKAFLMLAKSARIAGHPHGCGESSFTTSSPIQKLGSSPRVWGKLPEICELSMELRVIPTGVGKAGVHKPDHNTTTGHPHGCGESSAIDQMYSLVNGSSPRVWGKRDAGLPGSLSRRVIPTGVGKAWMMGVSSSIGSGHPHGCGESPPVARFEKPNCGSSPRVWGKLSVVYHRFRRIRVIPTGVGKALYGPNRDGAQAGHPHGCGESSIGSPCPIAASGSSPRVWGKPSHLSGRYTSTRVIPTGVGKALGGIFLTKYIAGHPHGCGESRSAFHLALLARGSSPRVWGKRKSGIPLLTPHRVIPTGVGKALPSHRTRRGNTGHPHGCGESSRERTSPKVPGGSSPRVWGKPTLSDTRTR